MNDPRCTCAKLTNSRGELVRYTDQLCPMHGTKAERVVLPHCPTCTCQVGSPIVQVPREKP